jgi:flagellar L-ring protein precursor FlgH
MKQVFIIIMVLVTAVGAISTVNLYSDHRAMQIDDILTILVVESAKAGSESSTSTNKHNTATIGSDGGKGLLDLLPSFSASAGANASYDGQGGTSREGKFVATISARVVKVLDNGNLVIDGSKVVEINEEKEIIKVSGIVRPQDIQKNNTVYSSSIADAQITYSGRGVANTGQRPGVIARFFNWIF